MESQIDHDHDFALATSAEGDVLVIAVSGQADLHVAPDLRASIGNAIDEGQRRLVIDLTEATFIDSMTLGVLLGALKRLSAVAGRLAIVCPNHHLRRVFEITSLDRILALKPSRREACDLVRAPADGVS